MGQRIEPEGDEGPAPVSSYPHKFVILDKNVWLHAMNLVDSNDARDESAAKVLSQLYDCPREVQFLYHDEYLGWVKDEIEGISPGALNGKQIRVMQSCREIFRMLPRFGRKVRKFPKQAKYQHRYQVYRRKMEEKQSRCLHEEDFFLKLYFDRYPDSLVITNDQPARQALADCNVDSYDTKRAIREFKC